MDISSPSPKASVSAGTLLGLALLLLLHRYAGITHDSVLYLGQGLLHLRPEVFAHDLFFLYGSQERFSLFPALLGKLFHLSSPPMIFLWGTLVGIIFFSAASWWCLSNLLPKQQRLWAWIGILTLPAAYGMSKMFSYGETFFTPRPIAEALSLISIALLATDRRAPAVIALLMAGLLHPLQCISALIVVWIWLTIQDRRWILALLAIAPILIAAMLDIAPFSGLFRIIDSGWKSSILERTPQLYVTAWNASDFAIAGFDASLLLYASIKLHGKFRTWCLASLGGLFLGLATSLVLVDALDLVLPAGLQLWRTHWLAHWFAVAAFSCLLLRDMNAGDHARALLLAFTGTLAWAASPWAWAPLLIAYCAWERIFLSINPRLKKAVLLLIAIGFLLTFIEYVANEMIPFRMAHYRLELYAIDRRILIFPSLAMGLALLGIWLWQKATRPYQHALLSLALISLLTLSATRWDSRPFLNRAFENQAFESNLFGSRLPKSAQVFWLGDSLIGTWLVLQHASYFHDGHFAGQIFNRKTGTVARQREIKLFPLLREAAQCEDRSRKPEDRANCHMSPDALGSICRLGPVSPPDYIVLPYRQPQQSLGQWSVIDPMTGEHAITYRIYSCAHLLEAAQD